MGKGGNTVRGKTKKETYSVFCRERDAVLKQSGLRMDYPTSMPQAYAMMKKDPKTGEFTLTYHYSA